MAITIVFIGLRLYSIVGISPLRLTDTFGYEECAQLSPFHAGFYACIRGWALPLYYKLLTDDTSRVIGQLAISCASWIYLATAFSRTIVNRGLRPVAYAAVLLFGCAFTITLWDGILLSESLTLSLAAVIVGAWISFLSRGSARTLLLLVVASVLWAFLRDANAVLVLLTVPFIVVWLTRDGPKRLRWVAVGSMVTIFVLTTLSADSSNPPAKRWPVPLRDVIRLRVLPDRAALAHFADAGMPVPPRITRVTDTWNRGGDWFADPDPGDWERWYHMVGGAHVVGSYTKGTYGYYSIRWPEAGKSVPFQNWVLKSGRGTYASFLLSNPLAAVESTWKYRDVLLSTPNVWRSPNDPLSHPWWNGRDALPAPIEGVIYPQGLTSLLIALIAVLGLAVFCGVRYGASIVWWVPAALLATAIPDAVFVWNSEPIDVARHALLVGVLPRLGLLMLLFLAVDSGLRRRAQVTRSQPR